MLKHNLHDCRVRSDRNDKTSKARTLYLNCEQYEGHWDEIASIFSREAILRGSLDKSTCVSGGVNRYYGQVTPFQMMNEHRKDFP